MLIFSMGLLATSFFLVIVSVVVLFNLPPFLSAMFQLSKEAIVGKVPDNGYRYVILYKLKSGEDLLLHQELYKSDAEKEFILFKNKKVYYAMRFNYECFEKLTGEKFDANKVSLSFINIDDSKCHIYRNTGIMYRSEMKERKKL